MEAFNREDFFEAHELWEQIWTQAEPPERTFLQALIHFAVGYHHVRRGNTAGGLRQLNKGLSKVAAGSALRRRLRTDALVEQVRGDSARLAGGGRCEAFPRIELSA